MHSSTKQDSYVETSGLEETALLLDVAEPGSYVVTPSVPSDTGSVEVCLTLYSSVAVPTWELLPPIKSETLEGEWFDEKSGGCHLYANKF